MTARSHAPRATFDNLPAEKRARIVELAIDEFSERPYSQASLSRIVARAGIAKGSIYQYFPNKFALYRWLITRELTDRKRAALAAGSPPAGDLFAQLEAMVHAGMRFLLDNPRLAALAANLYEPDADPEVHALHAELRAQGQAGMRAMLAEARRAGSIPRRVDLDVAAALVTQLLGPGLAAVLLARLGVDLRGLLKNPAVARSLKGPALRALVRSVVDVLHHGLAGTAPGRARRETGS